MTVAAARQIRTGALDAALRSIAAQASAREAGSRPGDARSGIDQLRACGALAANAAQARPPAAMELGLVRRVAAADGSVARILDGHLNAVERLATQAPPEIRDSELAAVASGHRLLGVWGGEPGVGEGPPAQLHGTTLRGVRTLCSGAGAVDAALVVVRDVDTPPALVLVDATTDAVEVDTSWFDSHGLTASMSHRVVFHSAPVIAHLGPVAQQPWFARDALRTAASWAGMADAVYADALRVLRDRRPGGDLEALAVGRMLTALRTIDVWSAAGAAAMDEPGPELPAVALHGRVAVAEACRRLLDEAVRACGSRPLVTGTILDRARRDLEVFLLQHRLDPLLARAGAEALG